MRFKGSEAIIGVQYNKRLFKKDLIAGLTLFIMLVPQGMAYAMLAGVPPVMGLYASTLPLIVYALFASSRHLSVGPTAITSLLIFSGTSSLETPGTLEYVNLVSVLALMVGVFQLLFGLFKMGFVVNFIPPTVLGGYTSAAAIIIGLSQLKPLLGIEVGTFFQAHLIVFDAVKGLLELNPFTFLIGGSSIAFLVIIKRINSNFPAPLLLILLSVISVYSFGLNDKGVQIVGAIPSGFPSLFSPALSFDSVSRLMLLAFIISILGFMESLAIGKKIADQEKYSIHPDRELRALGLANVIGALFLAFPVNGSFSRSAVNHQIGGVTQIVSIVTGVCIIITLLLFTSYFYYLPNAVLAAIILVAVYKLVDLKQAKHLLKVKPIDGWSWLFTFFVTLTIGIQWGILMGAIFSYLILLGTRSKPYLTELGYLEKERSYRDIKRFPEAKTRHDILVVRIDSSIYFSNFSSIEVNLRDLLVLKPKTKWVVMDFSGVNDIDTDSFERLVKLIDLLDREKNIHLYVSGMKGLVRDIAYKSGWESKNTYFSIEHLLEKRTFI
jgi:sulfate permease, SulP family